MTRWIALAALALVACAGEAPVPADEQPTEVAPAPTAAPEVVPVAPEVWLPEGHPAKAAQDAWGLPLPYAVEVVVVPRAEISDWCPEAGATDCNRPDLHAIVMADGDPQVMANILLHEMGHLLRGKGGHIEEGCPQAGHAGPYVMCASGMPMVGAWTPTATDYAFVLGEI